MMTPHATPCIPFETDKAKHDYEYALLGHSYRTTQQHTY